MTLLLQGCMALNQPANELSAAAASTEASTSAPAATTPTVTGVTSNTADGRYSTGMRIDIRVTFSEAVTVTGTPTITLETGTTDTAALYSSGSGSGTLVFTYAVASGMSATDLDYTSAAALQLAGGSIKGTSGGADATLALPAPGAAGSLGANKNIEIASITETILTASDGAAGDDFGFVAVSGDTVVVGAKDHVVGAESTGAAYIYRYNPSTLVWDETEISASDGADADQYGASVGVSGNTVVVGASIAQIGANVAQGAAYVYRHNPALNNWAEEDKLTASDGLDDAYFGFNVAISANNLAVTARNANASEGRVYVFKLDPSSNTWFEDQILDPGGLAIDDHFGESLAIDGNTIVAGADGVNVGGNDNQGKAFIYKFDSSANSWVLDETLVASDGAAGDKFGKSAAVYGNTVVVGAREATYSGLTFHGKAYVYQHKPSTNEWIETIFVPQLAPVADSYYGFAVAVYGNTIAIGAPAYTVGGVVGAGAIFLYQRDPSAANSWVETVIASSSTTTMDIFGHHVALDANTLVSGQNWGDVGANVDQGYVNIDRINTLTAETKLTASDGAAGDEFGTSVAVDGNIVVVGSYKDTVGGNANQGSAYIYQFNPSTFAWDETKLTASDGDANDYFGFSVSVHGTAIAVGARGYDVAGDEGVGAVYVYRHNHADNTWHEMQLLASDGAVNDWFGTSVSMSGDMLAVGAPRKNTNAGAVYVYIHDQDDNWEETKLTASDGVADDYFGWSVGMSGFSVVAGAPFDHIGANADQGSVYLFRHDPDADTWVETKGTASDGAADDNFGYSVAISTNTVVVGAWQHNGNQGTAYVYRHNPALDNWSTETKLTASDGAADNYFGLSVSAHGNSVLIGAAGANGDQGKAYVYRFNEDGNSWVESIFAASDGATTDYFGRSVSVRDRTIAVGAILGDGANDGQGAAYLFPLD